MAKRSHAFELNLNPDAASRAVRKAISKAGWESTEKGDFLEAHEDATKLCCTISPVAAEIRVREQEGRSRIQLDVSIPGWGMIPNHQLPGRLRMLERVIREQCAEPQMRGAERARQDSNL